MGHLLQAYAMSYGADTAKNSTCVTLTFGLLTWKRYVTHRSLMGCTCIRATYEANLSKSHRAMERAWPKIWTIYVTLTFDQLTWKWYATHYSLMGCIGATYEANLSNNHWAMEWTLPKIWPTYVTLTYWPGNGASHIVPSWVVFVPHMNIIHEIGNKPQSGHGMRDRLTEGRSETNISPTTLLIRIIIIHIISGSCTHNVWWPS